MRAVDGPPVPILKMETILTRGTSESKADLMISSAKTRRPERRCPSLRVRDATGRVIDDIDDRSRARPATDLPLTLGYPILIQRQISVGQKELAFSAGPNRQIVVSVTKRPGIWSIKKWFRCSPLQINHRILKKPGVIPLADGAISETDLEFGKKWFKCLP